MSGRLAKAAILVYGAVCLAFQTRLSVDWLVRESVELSRSRRPFGVRIFDAEGRIEFALPEGRDAGLERGDRLVALNGEQYGGAGSYYRLIDSHRPGDVLEVRVQRDSEQAPRDILVTLRPIAAPGGPWSLRDFVYLGISQILTPLLSLLLGLLVVIRRREDRLSWIVFACLLSFSIMSAGGGLSNEPVSMISQWEPALRVPALAHLAVWSYLWPVVLFVFAVHFPQTSEWEARRPWLLPALVAIPVLHALVRGLAYPAAIEALPDFRWLVRYADTITPPRIFAYLTAAGTVASFLETVRKLRAARDADTRRRLRILLTGSAIAWTPFLLMMFSQELFGVRAVGWFLIAALAILLVFPVTLVYLILVDRAMDVGVAIREGLQYALARRGLFVVQFLVVLAVIVGLGISLGQPGLSLPERMRTLGVGIGVAIISRRLVEKAGQWIDRRFFREQFQAGQLLSELAQQAGSTADRGRLREMVTNRISSTLHTMPVHLIDDGVSEYAGTLSRLSQSREPQWIDWRRPAEWMTRLDTSEEARLRDLKAELLLPVARQDRLLGFLALGPRRAEQPYSTSDVAVLESVAAQTALALDNARLAETVAHETASREILNRELQIAREVQERLLPRRAPLIPGLDVYGLCVPAREVGGDLFDYVALPDGQWALAVGDVAGKGVSAALIMASLQASLRGLTAEGIADLSELMARLNRLVYDATPSNRFATFQLGVFDPATHRMRLCGAGHNPALYRSSAGDLRWLRPKGVALGLVRETRYEQMELTLEPGSLLLFYTDGVTEASNPRGEMFGDERLTQWVKSAGAVASRELADDLAGRVADFTDGAPQHDDITIIAAIADFAADRP